MKLLHCQIIWYLFASFEAITLCSLHSTWLVKYVFSDAWKLQLESRNTNHELLNRTLKSLLDSVHPTKTLKEKRLKVDVCIIREILEKKKERNFSKLVHQRNTTCRLFNKSNSISKQVEQCSKQRMWHYQKHLDLWSYQINFIVVVQKL